MKFSDIIGHEEVRHEFDELIKMGKVSHAHIICGEDGIGKSFVARELAAKILGKTEIKEYADLIEWKISSGKKSISVDQVRSIIEEVNKKPYEADKKVIVIHDADYVTIQGQNALLKTIEEPPHGVFILLLCETMGRLLDTIRSRCQLHKMKKLSKEEMITFIKRKYGDLADKEIKAILAFSGGIPGKAEDFMENTSLNLIRNEVIDILLNIKKMNYDNIVKCSQKLTEYKELWQEVIECFTVYIRDSLVYKETGKDDIIINNDKLEDIKKLAMQFSMNKLNRIFDILNFARSNIESNVSIELTYNTMLFKIQEV
ncbi:DNA polymerase III subunit delta' [Clostridium guangxiense]|uniref:DNA polymerase III subunit delta' n=1 Tax=Clostridium guangxiense TaxID=1662055 RepID=UPI001E28B548|nr:DNA polymerase III subunit delta' [Clostridium guangxiense]MCD2348375.1 DNA polymerase III subunit delta' [Clostridium guangxiense]